MPAEFVLPAGLFWNEPPDPPPEEGFELQFRDDDESSHYFFYAQLSSLRLERFFTEALRCLPDQVHAVLEVRRPDAERERAPDERETDRWSSDLVPLADVLRVASKYSFQLLHDGTVGFGAYDPDSPLEVFLDDHKLVSMFAAELDPFAPLLESYGVPQVGQMASILDVDHEHVPLAEIPDRCPEPRREWLRRRHFDPRWFAPAIRRALDMQRTDDEVRGRRGNGGGADDSSDDGDDVDFGGDSDGRNDSGDDEDRDHGISGRDAG